MDHTMLLPTDFAARASHFWGWFVANSARLHQFEADQEAIFDALHTELQAVYPGLAFEFGPDRQGTREFVVSADGILERFPAVISLVEAAPELAGWQILAFRQPKGTSFVVRYGDQEVSAQDIWFVHEPDGERIGITLYVRDYTPDTAEALRAITMILIDAALGEYTTETRVGYIDWHRLPPDPIDAGLTPFPELPRIIGGWTLSA